MNRNIHYFIVTGLLLALTLTVTATVSRRTPDKLVQPLETIPSELAGWKAVGAEVLPPIMEATLAATSYLSREYAKDNHQLNLFISYYAQQRAGESMHSPKNCLPGAGWEIWRYDATVLPGSTPPLRINKYFIQKNGQRSVVFYWYESKQRIIASEYMAKMLLIRDAILDGHTGGAIVRVIVPDEPRLVNEGVLFSSAVLPYVQRCFRNDGMRSMAYIRQ